MYHLCTVDSCDGNNSGAIIGAVVGAFCVANYHNNGDH